MSSLETSNTDQQDEFLPQRILSPLVKCACFLVLGAVLRIWLESSYQFESRVLDFLFNLDSEYRFAAWYSSILLFVTALLWFACAVSSRDFPIQIQSRFRILAVVFALLSLDEVTVIHERLIPLLRPEESWHGLAYYPWVFAGALFVGIIFLSTFSLLIRLPRAIQSRLLLAAACFLSGVIGVEIQSGIWAFHYGTGSYIYLLIVTLEELLEIVGVLFAINALLTLLKGLQQTPQQVRENMRSSDFLYFCKQGFLYCAVALALQVALALVLFGPSNFRTAFDHDGYVEVQRLPIVHRKGGFSNGAQDTLDTKIFHGNWHNEDHVLISFREIGEELTFQFTTSDPDDYLLSVYLTKGWDYGTFAFYLNGNRIGPEIDLYSDKGVVSFGPIELARTSLPAGTHRLRIEVLGSNPNSQSPYYNFGIDGIQIKALEETAREGDANKNEAN